MKLKKFDNFKRHMEKILSSKYFMAAIIATAAILVICHPISEFPSSSHFAERGKLLFHGIKDKSISFSMPFISFLSMAMEYHSNISGRVLLKTISAFAIGGAYILSYMIGLNAKGRLTAIFTLLIVIACNTLQNNNDFEQIIYSFFIVLAVEMLILRSKNYNLKTSVMAGLAIGFTLFARSPLFLLPFLMVIFDYFYHSKDFKKYIINSLIFLATAYIILLPWTKVNHFLFNKFIPFEEARATCNIITSVKGTTFTMEADAKSLAGIKEEESAYKWAAKELSKNPWPFLSAIPKRLLQIFYTYPFLILLGLFGLIIGRKEKSVLLISIISGYFIGIHSLLPLEYRYLYPLNYLLAFPAARGLCFLFENKEKPSKAKALPHAIFYAALAIIIIMETVLITYPFRAKQGLLALNSELKKFPDDRWLLKKKGFFLSRLNMQKESMPFLETAYKINPAKERDLGYILSILKAKTINELSIQPNIHKNKFLVIKMFKELQLGGMNAAKKTFIIARNQWTKETFLRRPTSEKDFEIAKEIKKHHKTPWNFYVSQALQWWPIEERLKIISNFKKITPYSEEKNAMSLYDAAIGKSDRGNLLINHLGYLVKMANKKPFSSALEPLSVMNEIISDIAKKDDTQYLVNTFHPNMADINYEELKETIKLIEIGPDNDSQLEQAKKISSIYPDNILYEFIHYRLNFNLVSDENKNTIVKSANDKVSKNTYALLKGSWYLISINEPEKAKKLLKYAQKKKNKTTNETMDICLILQQLGEYKEALLILDKTIKNQSNNPELYNNRGVVLRFSGKKELAIEDFKKSLKINPLFYQARINLAGLYLLSNNKNSARNHYLKIKEQKSLPPEVIELAKKELALMK